MKIYIAVCKEHHIDDTIRVFESPTVAIQYAKKFAEEYVRSFAEFDELPIDGWLYHCQYGTDEDYVYVIEGELGDTSMP